MNALIDALSNHFRNKINAQVEAFRRMPFPGMVALLALLVAGLGSAQAHHAAARDGGAHTVQAQHAEGRADLVSESGGIALPGGHRTH